MTRPPRVTILGTFVADLAFRADRLPAWGETVLGTSFRMGPGGKGSNQAVAAARLGASVSIISKVGLAEFGNLARRTWADEGIDTRFVIDTAEYETGTSSIIVHETTGDNAIVVVPGSGFHITRDEVDLARDAIAESQLFMTGLELPIEVVRHGLALAVSLGVPTILNPAPAQVLPEDIYPLCDYFTPNETEATRLTGVMVTNADTAEYAAEILLSRGARQVIVTLGENGALIKTAKMVEHVRAFTSGPVVETTGAARCPVGDSQTSARGRHPHKSVGGITRRPAPECAIRVFDAEGAASQVRNQGDRALLRHPWRRNCQY